MMTIYGVVNGKNCKKLIFRVLQEQKRGSVSMASGSSLYYLMLVMVGITWSQKMGSNVEYRPSM